MKGKGQLYRENTTLVAGAIQRGERIKLERIPDVKRHALHGFIDRNIDKAEAVYTNDLRSHLGMGVGELRYESSGTPK